MSLAIDWEVKQGWKLTVLQDEKINGEIRTAAELAALGGRELDAQVPGDWPLDYVRHGLMEDPFFGDNYRKLFEYETCHVFYTVRFPWAEEPNGRDFLRFEGIDTIADVYLNGVKIGHSENMFIEHEFPAAGLRKGENELLVHLSPVALEARKYPIAAHETMLKYNYEALVIRKAAHCFGWDICPRIVSAGLWRPVHAVRKKPARIENVFLWLEDRQEEGRRWIRGTFDGDVGREAIHPYELTVEGVCGASRFSCTEKLWYVNGELHFPVDGLKLGWVRGYGEPALYDVTVTLRRHGETVDTLSFRQGFRTVKLLRDDAIEGEKEAEFRFLLNGKQLYLKGTNWVPADAFHSRDRERIPKILELVLDVGCNALRVWGGGVYEDDCFYDWCDEKGIFLWQDFMMACGLYPKTERMKTQLAEEARAVVRRLRHHASLCLWAGDNECDAASEWQTEGKLDPTDNALTREVLPGVLRAEDLSRPWLPSSPYISHESFLAHRFQATPEQHLWGPRDYYKGHFYHDHQATFASEMGYHGCNSPESIRRFIPKDFWWPEENNPMWLYHAASPETEHSPYTYRIALMSRQIGYLFRQKPETLEDYARMSQISQAEAKKYFVESFRSHKGLRTGLIWWNIMDNWPQFSDAVVDYYFCRKLAYFFIRRSQQPLCLMLDDKDGPLTLYAVNDRMDSGELSYRVTDQDSGETVLAGKSPFAADASTALGALRDDGGQHFYRIEWETSGGEKRLNHYLQGKPPFDYPWVLKCLRELGLDEFEGFGGKTE